MEYATEERIEKLRSLRERMGWEGHHTPHNLATAVASEAGELAHLYRFSPPGKPPNLESVADEVADVVIFCLNLCDVAGIDFDEAVDGKIAFNVVRSYR